MYHMNEELITNADECYRVAEQRAAHYFTTLYGHLKQQTYVSTLTKDIQTWKSNHIHRRSIFSFLLRRNGKPDSKYYQKYIQWLNSTGKLDNYLNRSVAYIFMRDLGKALDLPDTQARVQRAADSLKQQLLTKNQGDELETFSMAGLYRWAQKERIESTLIWVINKIRTVSSRIPEGMDAEQAQRKLIKLIGGVVMHVMEEMDDEISPKERSRKLEEAIRLGYSYGLTYPFIDDLLDSEVLSAKEKKQYSNLIGMTLLTGTVPRLEGWSGKNLDLMRYIHLELRNAFEYIKAQQRPETSKHFFEQSYVFFQSQEVDRVKDLTNAQYTNEELYVPVILKSASSRLIVRSVISADEDEGFDNRTFFYGIYNQLADDFADMFDDMKAGAVTPYTYYMKYYDKRTDLINPYELYWTVISYLIHNVYHSDPKVCEVILDRAINGLKRYKERLGIEKYNEVMGVLASGNPQFNRLIQDLVQKVDDVDFFDKLLRDHMLSVLRNERKEREDFLVMIETVRDEINSNLHITAEDHIPFLKEPIIDAANYSLDSGGKRLRPILTWVMGIKGYGLHKAAIVPLLKSLEYMHTASLIFDDLPSQDNAPTRRGRATLHEEYNTAIAEITGLFLTQKAIEEQASLKQFDAETVLNLIQYSSRVAMDMCRGQAMDLESKGKPLTLDQLNSMCFYKTGIAFEAALIMPAILANAKESEMEALKKFSRHAGIAFQIKDDLLDVEGNRTILGKPVGQDAGNNSSTFVSILGREAARKEMWDHYCSATEALQEVPRNTAFLKQLLNYVVNRDR
ncbi:polyprenyl synthetase family protein [Bacillus sp. JJ722]|uniref:polyprenyl synthetase family protein n=1 Tax=Bacillus sp. JJ722 TaxID=3122973 RepID=UPI002FFE53F0